MREACQQCLQTQAPVTAAGRHQALEDPENDEESRGAEPAQRLSLMKGSVLPNDV
jgi:hypothetical protein